MEKTLKLLVSREKMLIDEAPFQIRFMLQSSSRSMNLAERDISISIAVAIFHTNEEKGASLYFFLMVSKLVHLN